MNVQKSITAADGLLYCKIRERVNWFRISMYKESKIQTHE